MAASPARILILDDDSDVAFAAQLLLRSEGRQVDTLADPRQLARLLQQGVPDVVLLDFNFTPGRTDGAEGLKVLDQLRTLPKPPAVIAMTAYAAVALAVEAMKRGACDFITKPWDNERLLAAVDGRARTAFGVLAGHARRRRGADGRFARDARAARLHRQCRPDRSQCDGPG
jgi:DNA-binding NtrC family response regulator